MFVHAEAEITDPAGNPLGVLILETDEVLNELDLEDPQGPSSVPRRGIEEMTASGTGD